MTKPVIRPVVDYRVLATVIRQCEYVVPARSPEEAELAVETFIQEGAEPVSSTVVDLSIDDAFPVEEESMGEMVRGQYLGIEDPSE